MTVTAASSTFTFTVIPAKAGIQSKRRAVALDSRFRGNDNESAARLSGNR
jgi:hypothetical protein